MTLTLPPRTVTEDAVVPVAVVPPNPRQGVRSDLVLAAVLALALLLRESPSAGWLVGLYLFLVPGDLVRRACGVRVSSVGERVVIACAASIGYLVGLSVVTEGLSLLVGVGRPFAERPLVTAVCLSIPVLLLVAHRDGSAPPGPSTVPCTPIVLVLATAGPLLVMGGAARLDNGSGPALSVVGLGLAALLAAGCTVGGGERRRADLAVATYALSLAVLWSFSLRSGHLFGFDLHQEFASLTQTLQAEVWRPRAGSAYNASLSLNSVPATVNVLTGISGLSLLKVVYPMVFAVFPLAALVLLLRVTTGLVALALTVLLTLNPLGFWQIAAIARQELSLVAFVGLLTVLLVSTGSRRDRHVLAVVLGVTCVLTHYSTSYVAIVLLAVASVFGVLAARRRPGTSRDRLVHPALPVVLLLVAVLWGSVLNQSTDNVSRAGASVAAQPGLDDRGGIVRTWLGGGAGSEISAAELFDLSTLEAERRPWLQTYDADAQQGFLPVDVSSPVSPGVLPGLAPQVDLGYTIVRQASNLATLAAALALLLLAWRRRRSASVGGVGDSAGRPDVVLAASLAAGALLLLVTVRLSQGLAAAYNSERLVVQLAPVTALVLALLLSRVVRARPRAARPVAVVAALTLALALLDSTGVRGLVTERNAGNLQATGEFVQRYYVTDEDQAASDWLAARWRQDNLVFADRYSSLVLDQHPNMQRGVIDLLTPPMLDQRGYVYATTENVVNGRARSAVSGAQARYRFPTQFLDRYKTITYDNGSARIYR